MFAIALDTLSGTESLSLPPGSITLVTGPNGVGKSALLQDVYRRLPQQAALYYPGHRQITFSHGWENLQMSLPDLDTNLFSQTDAFNRYKSLWPEEQFKSVLRRLQNSENAYNQDVIEKIRQGEDAASLVSLKTAPMEILNTVFHTARMAVQFKITDVGITAVRGGAHYQIDRLSDGERAALFIVAAIVNRVNPGVIIIDEPERHLHPSISAPLISSVVRARPELAFVFATHDLNLIETLSVDKIVYVKDSTVIQERPERRIYDIRYPNNLEDITQDLKRDILGARDKVLFVEGEATSLDMPLYASCYPQWKVAPRGGHFQVQEAVRALNDNSSLHWMEVVGIVDGDGRDTHEISRLRQSKIIALPVPSIENLFFLPEVVEQVASVLEQVDGTPVTARLQSINSVIGSLIATNIDEIVARRTTWLANRKLEEGKISVQDARSGCSEIPAVDVDEIRSGVLAEFQAFLAAGPSLQQIETLPIKSTGIPAKIAELTGCSTLKKYKQTVLHQLEMNSAAGQAIRTAVVGRLPVLP